MDLDSFSSLLQLAATLNIAFVAVEYAKGYTNTLSEKIFRLPRQIEEAFKPLLNLIPDDETLNNITPHEVDGNSTIYLIEKTKREKEIFNENIKRAKGELNEKTTALCQSKSFSFLSLYFFFYSVIALFAAGLEVNFDDHFWFSWEIFTALSFIISIVCWIFGEKDNQWKFCDFSLLGHSIRALMIVILLSILCGCFFCPCLPSLQNIAILLTAALPFLSFVVFFFKIKHKVRRIKRSIEESAEKFTQDAHKIKDDVDTLISSCKLGDYLSTETKEEI